MIFQMVQRKPSGSRIQAGAYCISFKGMLIFLLFLRLPLVGVYGVALVCGCFPGLPTQSPYPVPLANGLI